MQTSRTATWLLGAAISTSGVAIDVPVLRVHQDSESEERLRVSKQSGDLRSDSEDITIELEQVVERALERQGQRQSYGSPEEEFYREREEFRSPTILLTFNEYLPSEFTVEVPIEGSGAYHAAVGAVFRTVNVSLTGEVDVYKCFDAETCAYSGTERVRIKLKSDPSMDVEEFQSILICGNDGVDQIDVQSNIIDPSLQKVQLLDDGIVRHLGVARWWTSNSRDDVENGASFERSRNAMDEVGVRYVETFRDYGGLKVQRVIEPHKFCNYTIFTSYPTSFRSISPLHGGCSAPAFGTNYRFEGVQPGRDVRQVSEWFFASCREVL